MRIVSCVERASVLARSWSFTSVNEKSILDRGHQKRVLYVASRFINGEESPRAFRRSQSRLLFTLSLSRFHSRLATFRRERLLHTHTHRRPLSWSETLSLSFFLCVVNATALVNKRDEIYGFVIPSGSSVGFSMRLLAKGKFKNAHGK